MAKISASTCAPHGVCFWRCSISSLAVLAVVMRLPALLRCCGGTRRFKCAWAVAGTALMASSTGVEENPVIETAGRAQMKLAISPSGNSVPSSMPVSARNFSSGYSSPPHSPVQSTPSMTQRPSSSRTESRVRMSAATASTAAPPNLPECTGASMVSQCTRICADPRCKVTIDGTPGSALPVSTTKMASASKSSGRSSKRCLRPSPPFSSEPSMTNLIVGRLGSSLMRRRTSRCMAMCPLQSAVPRPHHLPSFSVISKGSWSQSSRGPKGTMSWWA